MRDSEGNLLIGALPTTLADAEYRLKIMDGVGIDKSFMYAPVTFPPSIFPKDYHHELNDGVAKAVRSHPDRFIGLANIPLPLTKRSLEEASRIHELGLSGAAIHTSVDHPHVDSPSMRPLYEKLEDLGLPLIIHPTGLSLGYDQMQDYGLAISAGWEFQLCIVVCRLVLGGVIRDYPKLTFVVSHFGGPLSMLAGRLYRMKGGVSLMVDQSKSPVPFSDFDKYLDKIYFDSGGHRGWIKAFEFALSFLNPERIMFGTDFPIEISDASGLQRYIHEIEALNISQTAKTNIFSENARRIGLA